LGVVALSEIAWTNRFELLTTIYSHIDEYEITHVLLGDMGKEKLSEPFEMIRKKISQEKKIPVSVVSERLTTHQAEYHDGSHSDAACEILRDFLGNPK